MLTFLFLWFAPPILGYVITSPEMEKEATTARMWFVGPIIFLSIAWLIVGPFAIFIFMAGV